MNSLHAAPEVTTQFEQFCKGKAPLIASKSEVIAQITQIPVEVTQIITSFSPFYPIAEAEEAALTAPIITWVAGEGKVEIGNNLALMKEAPGLQEANEVLLEGLSVEVRASLLRVASLAKKALTDLTAVDQDGKLLAALQFNLLGRIEDDIAKWNKTNPNYVCAVTEEHLFSAKKP